MAQSALATSIADLALFEGLSPRQIAEISGIAERTLFREEAVLAKLGEPSDRAILIINGELECTEGVGSATPLVGNQTGRMIAEMALFVEDYVHPSTFVARTSTKALLIERVAMLGKLQEDRSLAEQFIKNISARLNGTLAELRTVASDMQPDKSEKAA